MITKNRQTFPMTGDALKTFLKNLTEAPPHAPCRCEIDGPGQATIYETSADPDPHKKPVAILRWTRQGETWIDPTMIREAGSRPPTPDEIEAQALAEDQVSIRIIPGASYMVEIESPIAGTFEPKLFTTH